MAESLAEKRGNRIKNWLKEPANMTLVLLLVFAIALRLYYFFMTNNQPLWWDEAEYLSKAKNLAFGLPDTDWYSFRAILFPLIAAVFFKIGLGIVSMKFVFVLMSAAEVFMVYLIGKYMFNKRIGLIAAFIFSIFYMDLFYSMRLLVDMPQTFFTLLGAALFSKYYFDNGSKKLVYYVLPVLFFGALIRFTVGIFIIVLIVFLLYTERFSLFKKKEWYISSLVGVLFFVPYLIYAFIAYGNPLHAFIGVFQSARAAGDTPWHVFMEYMIYMPNYVHWLLFLAFIVGLLLVISSLAIRYDLINKERKTRAELFLIIWVVIVLVYFGFFVNHFEDRYIFMAFPAIFIITGIALDKLYLFGRKNSKYLGIILVAAILAFGAYQNIGSSTALIENKATSYVQVEEAGIWIKANSAPSDNIISSSVPQNNFYSERATYPYPNNESDFAALLKNLTPKYIVLSAWEPSPSWAYNWPANNNATVRPVVVYYGDQQKTQISLVIYQLN